MAGGKQSARDKMIGMMYLVLTALLALQVSNAVLEKFIFIDATLVELKNEKAIKSSGTLGSITAEFNKKGQPGKDKPLYDDALKLRSTTEDLLKSMGETREKMATITGGYEDPKNKIGLVGAKDYDKVGSMMLKQKEGKELEQSLDNYVKMLNDIAKKYELKESFTELTKPAKEIDMFKNDPDQKNKTFLEITFENTPTAAGMASMSHLQTEVLEYEARLLEAIAQKIGAEIITINTIVPMVKPRSEVVTVGSSYEADLFIAASNSNLEPIMLVNGKAVKIEPDKHGIQMGKVKLPASSAGKKTFTAEITMNDTTFRETIEYEVITPTVTFSSASLQALYENCANPLSIQCPTCGTDYDPSITASNAKKINGNKVGLVEIVPTSRRAVTVNVANGGVGIGKQVFQVKPIPEPKIQIMAGTTRADNRDFVPLSAARTILIQAVPDETFKREVPKDAAYQVVSGKVYHSGGVTNFSSPRVQLNNLRPGPVSVQIDRVVRRRYDGKTENVTLDSKFKAFNVR